MRDRTIACRCDRADCAATLVLCTSLLVCTGDTRAEVEAGVRAYQYSDWTTAIEELGQHPDDPKAQYYLARAYLRVLQTDALLGKELLGLERKEEASVEAEILALARRSAAGGFTPAMRWLAELHAHGAYGLRPSEEEAAALLSRAMEAGNGLAPFELSRKYHYGTGVPLDRARARALTRRAAEMGDFTASSLLLGEAAWGAPPDLGRPAVARLLNAASAGDAEAQFEAARLYVNCRTPVCDAEQFRWMDAAAASGMPEALHYLAHLHEVGIGTPQNLDRAYRLYVAAARGGHARAYSSIGEMYLFARGVPRDYVLAWACFDLARRLDRTLYVRSDYAEGNLDAAERVLAQQVADAAAAEGTVPDPSHKARLAARTQ